MKIPKYNIFLYISYPPIVPSWEPYLAGFPIVPSWGPYWEMHVDHPYHHPLTLREQRPGRRGCQPGTVFRCFSVHLLFSFNLLFSVQLILPLHLLFLYVFSFICSCSYIFCYAHFQFCYYSIQYSFIYLHERKTYVLQLR